MLKKFKTKDRIPLSSILCDNIIWNNDNTLSKITIIAINEALK